MIYKSFKKSVCSNCKLRESCSDIPGFCLLLPYFAVASIILLLIYFISHSSL
jgi:hypothetical protein